MRVRQSTRFLSMLVGRLSLLVAASVQAESVYRCRDADGSMAYQDTPCADSQRQARLELTPPPPPSPSPDYARAAPERSKTPARNQRSARGAGRAEAPSYECRAANGEVFYRHAGCPKSIAQPQPERQRRGAGSSSVPVSAIALTRSEACRRLASAGSIGRRGRERDERVSTYERNAGRDPCR